LHLVKHMESVSTTLFYSAPLTPGGRVDNWECDAASRPPEVVCNFLTVGVELGVNDLRTATDLNPTLDGWGFQKFDFPTAVDQKDFLDYGNASIEAYIAETKDFLKTTLGADDVVHFDTCIRQKDTDAAVKLVTNPFVGPYQRVHVDQNPTSAQARLGHHVGQARPVSRFQIINVWRAFSEPVKNYPLALLDYRTVDPVEDLVVTRRILPEWMHQRWVQDREGFSLRHRDEHRWYHWSGLTPDEVVLFKCHDSASKSLMTTHGNLGADSDDGLREVAGVCAHSAFFDAKGPNEGHLRSSADLRFIVLYN
jgi:cephamycin C biosynthesis protein